MVGQVDNYSDDAPRVDPEHDDALGVAPFARRLAELLVALEAPNGYVVGLSGEWGSGKTSVLNFVKHYIEKLAPPKEGEIASILTIDFRPWLFTGHEDLIGSFFKVLAEQLGHAQPKWKVIAAQTAKLGADLSGALTTVGWLTSFANMGILAVASAAAKKSLNAVAEAWAQQPSLQKTYEDLRDILRHSPAKILVVIDDIDRLQPDEIRDMMMMVKPVGQLKKSAIKEHVKLSDWRRGSPPNHCPLALAGVQVLLKSLLFLGRLVRSCSPVFARSLSTQSRNVPLFSQVGMTPVWFWVGGEGVGNAGDARHPTAP